MRLVEPDNPILRQKAETVQQFNEPLRCLIRDMRRTMREHGGIGLAAPQVGSNLRVFVTENGAYVNPELVCAGERYAAVEGCLSLPGVQYQVSRCLSAVISARDEFGNPFVEHTCGLTARIWQHECDHLNGILITDY